MVSPTIVLYEGPDGAGKTHRAEQFAENELTRTGKVNYIHNDPPTPNLTSRQLYAVYELQLKAAVHLRDTNGVSTVIDRSFLSETIYGPAYRGKSLISDFQRRKLERYAVKNNIQLVGVEAPLELRVQRILERGERIDPQVGLVGWLYTQFFRTHKVWNTVGASSTNTPK